MYTSVGSASDPPGRERQDYLDRRQRLKELERQTLAKGKRGIYSNGSRAEEERPKAPEKSRGHVGSTSKGNAVSAASKEKKKLPYDRGFGSFFGPSEPVVARRVIEEAQARREAQIVAARQAIESREAEQKKLIKSKPGAKQATNSGKSPPGSRPSQKSSKLVDMDSEKARKLKEARDYSFLFEDAPVSKPKLVEAKVAVSKPAAERPDFKKPASTMLSNGAPKKAPVGSFLGAKSSDRSPAPTRPLSNGAPKKSPAGPLLAARSSDRSPASSRPLLTQSKSSQPSRLLSKQTSHVNSASGRSAAQSKPKVTVAKSAPNKVSSAGPSRPDPRKEANLKEAAMLRKLVAGTAASNGTKSSKPDRHLVPSQAMDRRLSETREKHPAQAMDRRHSMIENRTASLPKDRRPAQSSDKLPNKTLDRRAAQAQDKRPAQAQDRRPAQVQDRYTSQAQDKRPAQTLDRRAAESSERRPAVSQVLRKSTPASAANRSAAGGADSQQRSLASQAGKQSLQSKPALKGRTKPAPSNHNREKFSDIGQSEIRKKRPRSMSSEDSDDRPQRKKEKVGQVGKTVKRRFSDDDDDSLIDDDDEGGRTNVSSLIHKIMGYKPNKYRLDDDFDDRSMEVGFRHIQAEERRSAREARKEDEAELILIEQEERAERLRKAKKRKQAGR